MTITDGWLPQVSRIRHDPSAADCGTDDEPCRYQHDILDDVLLRIDSTPYDAIHRVICTSKRSKRITK